MNPLMINSYELKQYLSFGFGNLDRTRFSANKRETKAKLSLEKEKGGGGVNLKISGDH